MKHVGASEIRKMNAKYLRELREPVTIHVRAEPVRVLVPYGLYMKWQELLTGRTRKGEK